MVQEEAVTQAVEVTGNTGAAGRAGQGPEPEPEPEPGAGQPPSRRDRMRAATIEEIIATARRLLVGSGPEAVSLRAIAREMGMTAPGLYRYFSSHEELIRHVIAGIFTELGQDIRQAIDTADDPACADDPASVKLAVKMVAACREFRRWALDHRPEFALLFGVPLPGLDDGRRDIADQCALTFAGTFFALFGELWQAVPFPVPAAGDIDSGLLGQLSRYRDGLGTNMPAGAVLTFLRCWTLLYGAVAMEVFGHMSFALEDPAPMFEIMLGDLAALVGLRLPDAALAAAGAGPAERDQRGAGEDPRHAQLEVGAARRFALDPAVKPVDRARKRRPAEPQVGGLVEVRQRRPGHAGQHGQPPIGRRRHGEGPHGGQADQPIGYSHVQELALAFPLPPVRHGVKHEVRGHPGREGGQRTAGQRADQGPGQDMVGQQHVPFAFPSAPASSP
jgi:AcrR family transcriptional regulator